MEGTGSPLVNSNRIQVKQARLTGYSAQVEYIYYPYAEKLAQDLNSTGNRTRNSEETQLPYGTTV